MRVTSKDGTSIAYERTGSGPALILVGGGATDRSENTPLAPELAEYFTVYNYDRRGRGESGDTLPYAVAREIEDIEALITAAGGSAHLFGGSSGGALVLEAAAAGVAAGRLAMWEVPYAVTDSEHRQWQEYVEQLGTALAEGRRGAAFELFMQIAGSSPEDIAGAKASPYWPACEAIAHTLAYDAACLGDRRPPADRLATITQPTLLATGGGVFEEAADAVAACLPHAERLTLDGLGHMVDAKALGPPLLQFLRG